MDQVSPTEDPTDTTQEDLGETTEDSNLTGPILDKMSKAYVEKWRDNLPEKKDVFAFLGEVHHPYLDNKRSRPRRAVLITHEVIEREHHAHKDRMKSEHPIQSAVDEAARAQLRRAAYSFSFLKCRKKGVIKIQIKNSSMVREADRDDSHLEREILTDLVLENIT